MKLSFTFRFIKSTHKNMNVYYSLVTVINSNVANAGIFQKLEK